MIHPLWGILIVRCAPLGHGSSHENPRWGFIDLGFYHASNLRKAGRLKKFRIRGLHGSLQFVVLTGDWSCCYSSS